MSKYSIVLPLLTTLNAFMVFWIVTPCSVVGAYKYFGIRSMFSEKLCTLLPDYKIT